jgi:hypothetical protein
MKLDSYDPAAIGAFFRKHVDQGPEHVGCQLR